VVEDDRDTRELACEMLNALGHRAHGADGPETALGLLRMSRFAVLFTVQNMPSMTGEELAARAAEFTPGLRVILSSGEGYLPLDSSIALLPKPYDLFQLQAAISSMSRAPAAIR
jgi:DNA-binding NtrC family response regulator